MSARTVADPDVAAVLAWWTENARSLPWRPRRDVYAIWVSEVMSAQTSVTRAAARWESWMARWPTVQALAAARLADVLLEWQGLGYPRRARDLHRGARIVAQRGWPEELTELPGVGPYVASAIRCFALEQPVLPRDVNVRRVLARRFPEGVDPGGDPWRAGQALMELGQRICAALPRCGECPVAEGCPTRREGATDRAVGSAGRPGRLGEPALRARRQPRYEGSLRQRRGRLLARVLVDGPVALGMLEADDAEAAAGLAADGLVRLVDGRLHPPD